MTSVEKASVPQTWYAGVLACDLNTNLTNYTNVFLSTN